MLSRIPDSIDKREGSIIFDALAPAAYELESYYVKLNEAYLNTFVDTTSGEALDLRADELGVQRNTAVKAVRKGIFKDSNDLPMDVPIGSRFSTIDGDESLNFVVREKISDGIFRLECEQMGSSGNNYIGALMSISPVSGLGSAEITDIIIPGQEIESDDQLRARVKQYVRSAAQDGNVAQYYEWASNYEGIGRAKVFPLWDGVNTVKVSILNSLYQPADSALVDDFQDYLDPGSQGLGNGVAPVGAIVTVSTATTKAIDVSATISLTSGYSKEQADTKAQALLDAFCKDCAYIKNRVNYIEIGAILLAAASIEAVSDLTINEGAADIPLTAEEIPVIGTLTLTEAV
jgi:uncharacterized phage protein gp47/JayE